MLYFDLPDVTFVYIILDTDEHLKIDFGAPRLTLFRTGGGYYFEPFSETHYGEKIPFTEAIPNCLYLPCCRLVF